LPIQPEVEGEGREVNRMAEGRVQGRVKWFDEKKGYGFIECDDGTDIFVHFSAIQGMGFKTLKEGQRVEFRIASGEKGQRAEEVTKLDE